MLKTLGRLLDSFLTEKTLVRYPLKESQHAYQVDKSMETALHLLETKTEKQYALAVFMDIQEAFDPTTFAAIHDTLKRCDVCKTMIRWLVNMLSCRSIHLTYHGSSAETKAGVLSPLLWCIMVDSWPQQLNVEEYAMPDMRMILLWW